MPIPLISLSESTILFNLSCSCINDKINLLKYIEKSPVLMFEELIYVRPEIKKKFYKNILNIKRIDILKQSHYISYKHNSFVVHGTENAKFLFIEIKCCNFISEKNDILEFPELLQVEIYYKNENNSENIDISNIWIRQYNKTIIYGIALDCVSNMNNWVRVHNENLKSLEYILSNNNNIYCDNTDCAYKTINLDSIKVVFSRTNYQFYINTKLIYSHITNIEDGMMVHYNW
jgi:hypothetical protein